MEEEARISANDLQQFSLQLPHVECYQLEGISAEHIPAFLYSPVLVLKTHTQCCVVIFPVLSVFVLRLTVYFCNRVCMTVCVCICCVCVSMCVSLCPEKSGPLQLLSIMTLNFKS